MSFSVTPHHRNEEGHTKQITFYCKKKRALPAQHSHWGYCSRILSAAPSQTILKPFRILLFALSLFWIIITFNVRNANVDKCYLNIYWDQIHAICV